MKINIIFYSTYGHIYRMAEAVAEGAREVEGAEVGLFRVAETIPQEMLGKMGAVEAQKQFSHIPLATNANLEEADGLIFGAPTRYGNMAGQMRNFLDQTGGLWVKNALVDKIGSVFTSSGTQHGGQETTITSFHSTLLHHGMLIAGLPYSEGRQRTMSEISGGSPYGASTIAGGDGSRLPSENELAMARTQGRRVAELTRRLLQAKPKDWLSS